MMNQNDLENKGWDAMFQTLEREMPVEKKRRGAFWLWLCVGGLMLAGSAFLYFKAIEKKGETQTNTSKPIVYDNVLDRQTDKTAVGKTAQIGDTALRKFSKFPKSDNAEMNDATLRTLSKMTKSDNTKTGKTNDATLGTLTKVAKSKDIGTQIIENEVFTTSAETQDKLTAVALFDTTNIVKIETAIHLDAANKFADNVFPIDILKNTPLPIVSGSAISIKQDSSLKLDIKPSVKTILKPKKTDNKLIWGLTAGANFKQLQALDGFQAGLIVEKSLAKKWTLSTGLNFRQTKMREQNTSYLSSNADKVSGIYSSNTLQKAVSISVDKLYYLDAPVAMNYKITKNFAVESGLKLSYLVSQSTTTNYSSVYFVDPNGSSSTTEQLINVVKASTLGLNRWDAALVGGVKYVPTRHFQLGLKYDFGLFKINNRGSLMAFNRYVGLSGVYLF